MRRKLLFLSLALVVGIAVEAFTFHRSFRNGYPAGAQGASREPRTVGVSTNVVQVSGGFAKFRDRTWVTGVGTVRKVLPDDLDPPCHQRFVLVDKYGHSILVVNNIDDFDRLPDVKVGEAIAFRGEFIANPRGGIVHWTHPDRSGRRAGGWLKKVSVQQKVR